MYALEFEANINNGQLTIPIDLLAKLEPTQSEAVHITYNHKPRYVLLSEEIYQNLIAQKVNRSSSVWNKLLNKPCTGIKTKAEIDTQLKIERENWDKP
jgi:hypothetical protein